MLSGFNHVAILTEDLDRLEDFYRNVFDVEDVHHMHDGDLHHGLIRVGERSVLHAFERPVATPAPMFERGRLDHVALNVDDQEEFERLRSRLVDVGASAGEVTDFGALLSVSFEDPDGLWCEVCW